MRGTSVSAQKTHFSAILEAANGLPAVIYKRPHCGFAPFVSVAGSDRQGKLELNGAIVPAARSVGPLWIRAGAPHRSRSLSS